MSELLVTDEAGDLLVTATATFNTARTHRYLLTRVWNPEVPPAVFVMLNPSTADAFRRDPTVTRCLGFARREHAGGLVVLNLFGLRSTDPSALAGHPDPIGCSNNQLILESVQHTKIVIVAWGVHGTLRDRDSEVTSLLVQHDIELMCLGRNQGGSPKHPLLVRGSQPLEPYRLKRARAAQPLPANTQDVKP